MSAAEWIDFEELHRRAATYSKRTLERMIADGQISCRQRRRGAPRDFNWTVVESELALLNRGAAAPVGVVKTLGTAAAHELAAIRADAVALVQRIDRVIGRAA